MKTLDTLGINSIPRLQENRIATFESIIGWSTLTRREDGVFQVIFYSQEEGSDVDNIVDPIRAIYKYEERCGELIELMRAEAR